MIPFSLASRFSESNCLKMLLFSIIPILNKLVISLTVKRRPKLVRNGGQVDIFILMIQRSFCEKILLRRVNKKPYVQFQIANFNFLCDRSIGMSRIIFMTELHKTIVEPVFKMTLKTPVLNLPTNFAHKRFLFF